MSRFLSLALTFFLLGCGSTNEKSVLDISQVVLRSAPVSASKDRLYFVSQFSNELIAWDTTKKKVLWKKDNIKAPQRVYFAKALAQVAVSSPDSGKIYVYNEAGVLQSINEEYQQPFALLWIEYLQEWIVSDVGLNRVYIADKELKPKYFIEVDAKPRGLSFDGKYNRLLVAPFLKDKFYTLERVQGKWQNKKEHLLNQKATFAQNITLYKDEILIAHQRSNTDFTPLRFDDIVRPLVSRFKRKDATLKVDAVLALHVIDKTVSKPVDIRIDSQRDNAWILNANSNNISVINLKTNELSKHLKTQKQPTILYMDEQNRKAYVYNSLSYTLEVFDMDSFILLSTNNITQQSVSGTIQLGMEIFYDATNPKAMKDNWLSCENCHPDGKSDNQLWQQGSGPRNTTSLEGLLHTGMIHWSGDRDEVQDFEHTFRDLMQGSGFVSNPPKDLGEKIAGKSVELDAMASFVHSLDFPLALKQKFYDVNASVRGKFIFEKEETKCLSCHKGEYFTDSNESKLNGVGTISRADDNIKSAELDTPTLRGLYFSAPYLHDSSVKTLMEVFSLKNKDDLHGVTSQLSQKELEDLVEYLKSL